MTHRATGWLFFLVLACITICFRQSDPSCNAIREGRFHAYNNTTGTHYIIIRKDSVQQEVNTRTGDTSFWRIKWLNNCSFSATWLSGAGPASEREKLIFQTAVSTYQVLKVTPAYYTGRVTITASNGSSSFTDTTWLHVKQ